MVENARRPVSDPTGSKIGLAVHREPLDRKALEIEPLPTTQTAQNFLELFAAISKNVSDPDRRDNLAYYLGGKTARYCRESNRWWSRQCQTCRRDDRGTSREVLTIVVKLDHTSSRDEKTRGEIHVSTPGRLVGKGCAEPEDDLSTVDIHRASERPLVQTRASGEAVPENDTGDVPHARSRESGSRIRKLKVHIAAKRRIADLCRGRHGHR